MASAPTASPTGTSRAASDWWAALRPPPRLTVSQWADTYRQLSAEDSAEPGQWSTARAEYLREPMDAVCEPDVEEVVLLFASQLGKTASLLNILGYYIDQDPAPTMWVTVSLGEAEAFSRDRFEPFRRDNPRIAARIGDPKDRSSSNTILDKRFAGGRLLFRGGNSAKSLRGHPVRIAIQDEVDAYDLTTKEGEPTKLVRRRTVSFWNRKIVISSTPADMRTSRVWTRYQQSDRRRFWVHCPGCGHEQTLVFAQVKWDKFPDGKHRPETSHYLCAAEGCGRKLTDVERWDAVKGGRWIADGPRNRIAGFWINELYSPFRRLEQCVQDFLDAKDDPTKLKEWQQQAMAEPWQERGEAPDWEMLYRRREPFRMGIVPAPKRRKDGSLPYPPCLLTAGVDTQDDRLEVAVQAWNRRKESWLVHYEVINGDTSKPEPWLRLAALLAKDWPCENGAVLPIRVMCVDRGGHRSPQVDAFSSGHPQPAHGPAGVVAKRPRTVVAVHGRDEWRARVLTVSTVDGKKRRRSNVVVTLGTCYLKSEIATWLRQGWPTTEALAEGAEFPVGAHHVSEDIEGETYFRQLCAEQLVTERVNGVDKSFYKKIGGARNEAFDVFVYGRAAAHMVGVDHFRESEWRKWEEAAGYPAAMLAAPSSAPAKDSAPPAPAELAPPPAAKVNRTTGRARGGFWAGRR